MGRPAARSRKKSYTGKPTSTRNQIYNEKNYRTYKVYLRQEENDEAITYMEERIARGDSASGIIKELLNIVAGIDKPKRSRKRKRKTAC